MAGYRVEFADLLTDRTIARFDVTGLRFSRKISAAGSITGQIAVRDPYRAEILRTLLPQRTALWVYSGQDVHLGGVMWTATPRWSSQAAEVWEFQGSTFESYLNQVIISEDVGTFTQVDQLDIARGLVQHMQSDPTADIGIQLDPALSGVLRDRSEYLATANKSYGEALSQLGEVENGFEWTIDVSVAPTGERVKYLRFGYPIIGSPSGSHVLERQHLQSWTETGGVLGGTRYRARGGTPQGNGTTEQQPCISDVYAADDLLAAGWPRIDVVTDYATVTYKPTLNEHAARDLARGRGAVVIPQVAVNLDQSMLSTLAIGDEVRLRMDTLMRGPTDTRFRLTGVEVDPEDRDGAGTATLTLEEQVV